MQRAHKHRQNVEGSLHYIVYRRTLPDRLVSCAKHHPLVDKEEVYSKTSFRRQKRVSGIAVVCGVEQKNFNKAPTYSTQPPVISSPQNGTLLDTKDGSCSQFVNCCNCHLHGVELL